MQINGAGSCYWEIIYARIIIKTIRALGIIASSYSRRFQCALVGVAL